MAKKRKAAKLPRLDVRAHARVVMPYPQVTRWPSCEADIRSPESVRWREGSYGSDRVARLLERGLTEMACGNVASYTIDGHWFCRKHAGTILLDLLALSPLPSNDNEDMK